MVRVRAWALCAPLVLVGVANLGEVAAAPPTRPGLTWYRTWTGAQAAARAEGKLVLAASTRAGCGLCDRFRTETAPQCGGQLSQVAVGYVYDIGRPEMVQVDRALRSGLPGARLMPLVGFLTPEMEWVHGFWGGRTPQQFLGDIDYARRVRPVKVVAATQQTAARGPSVAAPPSATTQPASARSSAPALAPGTRAPLVARHPGAPRADTPTTTPNLPAVNPTPPPTDPRTPRAPGACQPAALAPRPSAAPSACPTHEECCPGGVCGVPSILSELECGPPEPCSVTTNAADAAAAAGDWCAVLKLTRDAKDPRSMALGRRARQWAQDKLDWCVREVVAGHTESALESLRKVSVAMAGEPAAVDAERGIDAVLTARALRRLDDPSGEFARSLRRHKYDELRGTRWARLFDGA